MKLSKMGIKTSKTRGTDEMFAHEFLLQSGQLKNLVQEFMGLDLCYFLLEKILSILFVRT